MYDYWVVTDKTTGRVICHCAAESDALMMISFDKDKRTYRKQRFIMDQVIDITSETDKQLPGQQGLPAGKIRLEDAQQQLELRESDAEVFVP